MILVVMAFPKLTLAVILAVINMPTQTQVKEKNHGRNMAITPFIMGMMKAMEIKTLTQEHGSQV